MKLKEVKKVLDELSKEELEGELFYNSKEFSISGVVQNFGKAKSKMYWTGEGDPVPLYTNLVIEI